MVVDTQDTIVVACERSGAVAGSRGVVDYYASDAGDRANADRGVLRPYGCRCKVSKDHEGGGVISSHKDAGRFSVYLRQGL